QLYLPNQLDRPLDVPRNWSTNTASQTRSKSIALHRREARLQPRFIGQIPVVRPERGLVDAAISLSLAEIIRIGDALIRADLTSPSAFIEYAWNRHLQGVCRSRMGAWMIGENVDSFTETDVRLVLFESGLPAPETNGA